MLHKKAYSRRKKPFCKYGHDVLIWGRTKDGRCKGCLKEPHLITKGKQIIQFCPKGHDTFECGRRIRGYCIKCDRERVRIYHIKNKEKQKIIAKIRRERDKNKTKLMDRKFNLKRCHGLTLEDYDVMLKKQKGQCAICSSKKAGGKGAFNIDHNHKTGQIRGLLCNNCNLLLGYAKESKKCLKQAILYLKKYEKFRKIQK
jgi:hypothetical protein